MDKISPEIESSVSNSSGKDGLALLSITHIHISPIQNNPSTYFSSLFLSYKSSSSLLTSESEKLIVEIKENDNINSDVEIQLLSPK